MIGPFLQFPGKSKTAYPPSSRYTPKVFKPTGQIGMSATVCALLRLTRTDRGPENKISEDRHLPPGRLNFKLSPEDTRLKEAGYGLVNDNIQ